MKLLLANDTLSVQYLHFVGGIFDRFLGLFHLGLGGLGSFRVFLLFCGLVGALVGGLVGGLVGALFWIGAARIDQDLLRFTQAIHGRSSAVPDGARSREALLGSDLKLTFSFLKEVLWD